MKKICESSLSFLLNLLHKNDLELSSTQHIISIGFSSHIILYAGIYLASQTSCYDVFYKGTLKC
jgi:hypothetical protein